MTTSPRPRQTHSMRAFGIAVLLISVHGALAGSAMAQRRRSDARERPTAIRIEATLLTIAPSVGWPGFDLTSIPLAIFDGDSTWLFRHPSPPSGFVRRDGEGSPSVMPGRHPALTANSSADIGGQLTATLLSTGSSATSSALPLAAIAVHESFHVFQRTRHRGWQANEGDLFLYPVTDGRRLALRRLETDALRRAQHSTTPAQTRCWARRFLALRDERFAGLDTAFARYERLTEMNEGLATYVETVARGHRTVPFPDDGFAAGAVRLRSYTTGAALGLLLDRLRPEWKSALETDDRSSLEALLGDALARDTSDAPVCAHMASERRTAARRAAADSSSVITQRVTRRIAFEARAGTRLVVVAPRATPLWPQGFDPLNVQQLQGGLLHTRFLKLGNASGSIEMLDAGGARPEALTVGAGVHPLFDGVQRLVVAGITAPTVREEAGAVTVTAPGVTMSFTGATVHREGPALVVTLGARPQPQRAPVPPEPSGYSRRPQRRAFR